MTELKLEKVVSFSSEDNTYKASNLLNGQKWLGAKDDGRTEQTVTIQLENPSAIRQISIENDSSAIIDIYVAEKCDSALEDFVTILPAVSFMSPIDSKNKTNTNRLKIFTDSTNLSKDAVDKKWRLIRVTCNQPFNKELQFGISSIKFYDRVTVSDESIEAAKIKTGIFSIKKELSIVEPIAQDNKAEEETAEAPKHNSMFLKWKNSDSVKNIAKLKNDGEEETNKNDEPGTSLKKQSSTIGSNNLSPDKSKTYFNPKEQIMKGVIFALSGFQNPLRSELRDKGMKLGAKYRPDWTDDCTHLISAFANTPKGNVAKKADGKIVTKDWILDCDKKMVLLDWEGYQFEDEDDSSDDDEKPRKAARDATKLMKKINDELYDSHDEEAENSDDKEFIVDSDDESYYDAVLSEVEEEESEMSSSDSDDSDDTKKKKKRMKKESTKTNKAAKKKKNESRPAAKAANKSKEKKAKKDSESEEDELEAYRKKKEREEIRRLIRKENRRENRSKRSAKDSEDEENADDAESSKYKPRIVIAERVPCKKSINYGNDDDEDAKNTKKNEKKELEKVSSNSSNTTEVNSDMEVEEANNSKENNSDDWQLPSFFADKSFYICGDFDKKKAKSIKRTIVAFAGNVNDYLTKEVDYVITDRKWDEDFDEDLKTNKNLKYVSNDWIDACNRRKKLVAFQPYEIISVE